MQVEFNIAFRSDNQRDTDVKLFITSRRYEGINLHNVLQGFSIGECDWLLPPRNLELQTNPSQAESLKRRELLEEFLFWYFDSFVLPLLKVHAFPFIIHELFRI